MKILAVPLLCLSLAMNAIAAKPPPNPMSGKPVAELAEILGSDAPEMDRANAALALAEFVTPPTIEKGKKKGGPAPEWELVIPDGFLEAAGTGLTDSASAVRFYSGRALSIAGAETLPTLIQVVESGDDETRISAMHAIGRMAKAMRGKKSSTPADLTPVFGSSVPVLQRALKDENYIVREVSCATFSRLGLAGAPALDDLISALEDKEFCVVNRAVHAVAAVDSSGAKSVPALVKALGSEHEVREFIVKELGNMGLAAKGAVPALCELVGEDKNSWQVALESAKALMKIVSYEEAPAQDEVVEERKQALHAIGAALGKQDAKFLWARMQNVVLDRSGYCPVGPEAEPLVEWFEGRLREYARTEKGYFGPPLPQVAGFLAEVGKDYKTDHLVALAKELKAANDTNKVWLDEFAPLLELESK